MIETASLVEYWERGFLAAPGLFDSAESAAWRGEADRLSPGAAVRGGLIDHSALFASLVGDHRLHELVGMLFGHEGALLDASLITGPRGGPADRLEREHPTRAAFGIPADQMLTVVLGIDGGAPGAPTLEVLPASHRPLFHHGPLDSLGASVDLSRAHQLRLEPGDAVCVHSMTPHRHHHHGAPVPPRALHLTYVVDPVGGVYDRYRAWRG